MLAGKDGATYVERPFMTALLVSGATCLVTLGGGLLVLRLQAYRGLVLAFCAGVLVAGALMDVIPDALQLLESTHTSWHHQKSQR